MTDTTVVLQVPSEDPKKKEEQKDGEKAKVNGEVKEGEDLVSSSRQSVPHSDPDMSTVRGGPPAQE